MFNISGFLGLLRNVDFGASRGSCGVAPLKLKKGYFLNEIGKAHDKAYKTIDWDRGSGFVDNQLYWDGMTLAATEQEKAEVRAAFRIARTWGEFRYLLNKVGVRW